MNIRQQMNLLGAVGLLAVAVACGGMEEQSSSALASNDTGNVEQAAAFCQCTDYVNNRFSLGGGYPDAQYWGTYLTNKGYKVQTTPAVGDVVVYSAARMGNCCGHVGVVAGVASTTLSVRGANQSFSGAVTEYNCTNVTQGNFNRRSDGTEKYYRK